MGQMSFFSADALPRAVTDLEGVLCAGGTMTVFGRGSAARLAIVLGVPPPAPDPHELAEPDGAEGPDDAAGGGHDHRAPVEVRGPAGGPPVPDDHVWEEGVDEIPDDDLPVRPDDLAPPDGPAPPPATPPPDPVATWRAHALRYAFEARGVPAEVDRLPDGRPVVRTAFRADLVALARNWHAADGAKKVPGDLDLDGPRLRLWILAAGSGRGLAYALGLDPHAPETHEPLLTACQRAGLGASLAGDPDEPAVVVVGSRRQRRLAELAGRPPRHLVGDVWPGHPAPEPPTPRP